MTNDRYRLTQNKTLRIKHVWFQDHQKYISLQEINLSVDTPWAQHELIYKNNTIVKLVTLDIEKPTAQAHAHKFVSGRDAIVYRLAILA